MPSWCSPIVPAATRSKFVVHPTRSIQVSQCWRITDAFSSCFSAQNPPVILSSSGPRGRNALRDGLTGPPRLATRSCEDIVHRSSRAYENGDPLDRGAHHDSAAAAMHGAVGDIHPLDRARQVDGALA